MLKRDHVSYSEFMEAVNSLNNVECIGCVEDTLLDNLLYIGDNDSGIEIVLLAEVQYLNEWSSCYTVRTAITESEKQTVYNRFNDIENAASDY